MNPKKMNKEQLIAKVDELQTRVDSLLVQSREADELNEEKASAIDNLKNQVAKLDEALANKNKDIAERREANVALTKEVQTLRKQVASIREDAQGMESRIAELILANSRLKVWKYVAIGAIIAFLIALCVIIA